MTTANPLDQLKDIHLPEPVGFWPLAPGWWMLAVLLILLFISGLLIFTQWRKGAYRRIAVQQVNRLFNEKTDANQKTATQLNQLLKTVAQQTYSTTQVSRLSADQWLAFLDSSANMQTFNQGPGEILATGPYERDCTINNPDDLKKCCIQWIRKHR